MGEAFKLAQESIVKRLNFSCDCANFDYSVHYESRNVATKKISRHTGHHAVTEIG